MSTSDPFTTDQTAKLQEMYARGNRLIDEIRSSDTPRVYIISGPSGVGKDTVIDQLRDKFEEAAYVVTATTRPMRKGEVNGIHYQFMTEANFKAGIGEDAFIEHELVYGNHYGVPKAPIISGLAENRDVIIKVDVQGAKTLRERINNTISIFLAPESMESLFARLRARKTDDIDVLMGRFSTASDELARVGEFDYVVFNEAERLDLAVTAIVNIIQSERCKVARPEISIP